MHYIVLEIQESADGSVASLINAYATEREALAKYYQILSAAAISDLKKHGAVLLTDEGTYLRSDCFIDSEHYEPGH
jgi:hypothetical protein